MACVSHLQMAASGCDPPSSPPSSFQKCQVPRLYSVLRVSLWHRIWLRKLPSRDGTRRAISHQSGRTESAISPPATTISGSIRCLASCYRGYKALTRTSTGACLGTKLLTARGRGSTAEAPRRELRLGGGRAFISRLSLCLLSHLSGYMTKYVLTEH